MPPLQAVPQAAQWFALLVRSTHAPPQGVYPGSHVDVQLPPLQGVPLATAGQALPQLPQLLVSVLVSTHALLHMRPHAPPEVQHLVHPAPHDAHAEAVHAASPPPASPEPSPEA